ncbi:MAG: M43 family zinc metalloprotease [Bacteroidota bacterium]
MVKIYLSRLFALTLLLCTGFGAVAQRRTHTCGTDPAFKKALEANPGLQQSRNRLADFTREYTQRKNVAVTNYTIPVVVHIIHNFGPENIPLANVNDAISILNQDFNLLNTDRNDVIPAFSGIRGSIGITFKLATIDPNGNFTNGVTYTVSSNTTTADENIKYEVPDYWDPQKYLNIYVTNRVYVGTTAVGGYAYYPADWPTGDRSDGILINYYQFGSIPSGGDDFAKRSLTHECGHYFNLAHTFGNSNGVGDAANCDPPGDDVDDTPPTIGILYDCNTAFRSCNNVLANTQNYMDYGGCSRMFTIGQTQRMDAALNSTVGGRSNLWSSGNLCEVLSYVQPSPVVTAGGPTILCTGGAVALSAPAAPTSPSGHTYTYQWYKDNLTISGAVSRVLSVSSPGSYDFRISEANCTSFAIAPVVVTVLTSLPTPTITTNGTTAICNGNSVTLSGPDGYSYLWSNGATTQSITVASPGSFTLRTVSGNCTSTASAPVAVTISTLSVASSAGTSICSGTTLSTTAPSAPAYVLTGTDDYLADPMQYPNALGLYYGGSKQQFLYTKAELAALGISGSGYIKGIMLVGQGQLGIPFLNYRVRMGQTSLTDMTTSFISTGMTRVYGPTTLTPIIGENYLNFGGAGFLWDGVSNLVVEIASSNNLVGTSIMTTQSPLTITTNTSGLYYRQDSQDTTIIYPITSGTISSYRPNLGFIKGYSYSWSPTTNLSSSTVANPVITNLTASRTYTVTAYGAGPCSLSTSILLTKVTQPTAPVVTSPNGLAICPGTGSVSLQGPAGYTVYDWSNGQATQNITVATAGTYSLRVANGSCYGPFNTGLTVTKPFVNAVRITTPDTSVCAGASGTFKLHTVAESGAVYSWAGPSGFSSNAQEPQVTAASASGNYILTITKGGCTFKDTVAFMVTTLPVQPTITVTGSPVICGAGSVTLTSSSTTGNIWSNGSTSRSITVSSAGNYTVKTVSGGCTSSSSVITSVTTGVTPSTPILTVSGSSSICAGSSVTLTSSAVSGNVWGTGETTQSVTVNNVTSAADLAAYTVRVVSGSCTSNASATAAVTVTPTPAKPNLTATGPLNFCSGSAAILTSSAVSGNLWSTGETTQSITVNSSGSYFVRAVNGSCTGSVSDPVTVTVNPLPAQPTVSASGSLNFCEGSNVVLSSSAISGNIWSTGETTQSITVSSAGNYTVKSVLNGCTSAVSQAASVSVGTVPARPNVSASGALTFCAGNNVVLSSSAVGGNLWSTGETAQSITITASGVYTVRVINGNCTSQASAASTVTVNSVAAQPVISSGGPLTFCQGASVTLSSSSVSGNLWSTGETSQSIITSVPGTYTVRVITGTCTSAVSGAAAVTVNPVASKPIINTSGSLSLCTGSSVTLNSSSASGNLWSTGETTQSITVGTTGSYNVRVVTGSCTSEVSDASDVVVNPIPPAPSISASGSQIFCEGGSVTLSSNAASGNLWSDGSIGQTLNVTASGTYTVRQVVAGCTSSPSIGIVVNVRPKPATPTITTSGNTVICEGATLTLTSLVTTGNLWNSGETTQSITVSAAGSYNLRNIANGCTSDASVPVVVTVNPSPPAPTITASGSLAFCEGGSVTLTSSAATGNVWSNGLTTGSITVTASGTYSVRVADLCIGALSAPISVTVTPTPVTPSISLSGSASICPGDSVTLVSSAATGNTWSNGATSSSIVVKAAGTYSVSWVNAGCTSLVSAATAVTMNPKPGAPNLVYTGSDLQTDSAGVLYRWFINGLNTFTGVNANLTPNTSGRYAVSVRNSFGCWSDSSAGVQVILGIAGNKNAGILNLFPNPAGTEFVITGLQKPETVILFDNLGRKVMQTESVPGKALNVSELPNGLYYVVVQGRRLKLVKN